MKSLAFKIANDLLFAGVIAEDAKAEEVQSLIQARLTQEGIGRTEVVHFQDTRLDYEAPYGICHQKGVTRTTGDKAEVTCQKCLRMLAQH